MLNPPNGVQLKLRIRGGSAADVESQRDDYEAGKTPVEAYCDEWGDE